ncbi:hypothetical protein ACFSSA_04635 [Luteolibacter algae]|uniref:Uncharacterized protein n=1 Tax=Luteolibacter algae TaxID=454151 RepID=A0ABW5D8E8_9BACT
MSEGLGTMNRRAHERARRQLDLNRRVNRRGEKSIWASIAIEDMAEQDAGDGVGLFRQLYRLLLGLVLLPLCWVTTWTFLRTFSHATVEKGFWQSAQFWYFTVGVVLMLGWFWSKLAQPFFLYLYVFGHEVTHAAFVKCFGGKVLEIEWGADGGYVTTDKTNWVIALSPYFVPFWSVIALILYVTVSIFTEIRPIGNLVFYSVIGATWAFHLAWTLWMIPRDQPDLSDNGTFLSLVLIWFGNLLVLVTLLCFSSPAPLESFREFGFSWLGTAATWGDQTLYWLEQFVAKVMTEI